MIRTYKTNVTIIIDDGVRDNEISFAVLNELQEFGLEITETNHEMGVLVGTIPSHKVHEMKKIFGVSCVREMSSYLCELESSDASGN